MSDAPGERQPRKRHRRPTRWLPIVGVAILATAALYAVAYYASEAVAKRFLPQGPYAGLEPIAFTREGWLAGSADRGGSRYLMLDDLLAKHPLEGKPRAEVVELLGPLASPGGPGSRGRYYLGPENSPFGSGDAWLVLVFDAEDRVGSLAVRVE